tara:strand:+ start:3566 stop:4216 length:651 start_codon:yes stop_codon:yes gene_type:complete
LNVSSILEKLFPGSNGGGSKSHPWIIIGLGNPGDKYKNTRHNVGWWCMDEFVRRTKTQINNKQKKLRFGELELNGNLVVLAYPQTFMNRSGTALNYLVNRYKTDPEKILILSDDINLPPGSLRIKKKGGPGGHNGLKSIISVLGTNEFPRVRIGVGNPESGATQVDHVLSTFEPETKELVIKATYKAVDAIEMIIRDDLENAMNKFNRGGEAPKAH